ncbi:RimK family alpha-L-glutamate ligase [Caldichromatium japonicum]|uniref:RimK family alpha-L-glutamate ligase n=2 Tax=Caldichromatium japonicum TaxID=2699430 RepID=A0A6G7VGH9_9GAMM|nr:RimK family alpha-L-glutamate ligase [Caldichromatium japonicum]
MRRALAGEDLRPLSQALLQRADADPHEAGALLDAAILCEFQGRAALAANLRREALRLCRHYRVQGCAQTPALRVLALKAAGPLLANTPIECLLADGDIALEVYYVGEDLPDPETLPEHDLLFVAIGESDAHQPLLAHWAERLRAWPRPVINDPRQIIASARDRLWQRLQGLPGVLAPPVWRLGRAQLADLAAGQGREGYGFPLLIRPIDSHAGQGLTRIDRAEDLAALLASHPEPTYFVSPFIDYRSPDGWFRKFRLVWIGGQPLPVHLAISERWMIHYLNAGMDGSAVKRAEEADFFKGFESGFAQRHAKTLAALHAALGLDYVGIDGAELPDGRLLLFEADPAMVVHDMDPPAIYPYKLAPMRRLFAAFREFLSGVSKHRPPGLGQGV